MAAIVLLFVGGCNCFAFCRWLQLFCFLSVAAIVMLFMGGFMFMLLCFVMGSCNFYGFLSVAAIFMICLLWAAAIFMLFIGGCILYETSF